MKFFTTLTGLALGLILTSSTMFAQISDMPFSDLPPTDEFGKCYAKCKSADVYETVTKRVLVKEASTKLRKIPAVYETRTERVMVKEGATTYRVIPATYKTETDRVVIQSEQKKIRTIPAKYTTKTRQVLVSEARGEWVKKKKDPSCFSENPEDCYIACYEEIPAKYRTETYQILATPAQTIEEVIPAKYQTVTKRVIDQPARTEERPIDPVYKTITSKVLVSPATTTEEVIPAQYKDVKERKLVSKGSYTGWTEILCAAKTSDATVKSVQRALKAKGYDVGPVDGVMGVRTQAILKKYQQEFNLPIGNLNIETLKSLGVNY
jgi:restriction endonuclease Mrr